MEGSGAGVLMSASEKLGDMIIVNYTAQQQYPSPDFHWPEAGVDNLCLMVFLLDQLREQSESRPVSR